MLGALLSRFKKARISFPGGCDIGTRPINIHLFGLEKLGSFIIAVTLFAVMYFVMIRPQKKKQKAKQLQMITTIN